MRSFLKIIDSISDWTGKTTCWLAAALVGLISLEVILRYVFNSPTMWGYETQLMAGGVLYAMGWAYAQRHRAHIRIDIVYLRLPPRYRAGIDVFGTFFTFFPLLGVFTYAAINKAVISWKIGEVGVATWWYPPLAPFRTAVAIGFLIFFLQGLAQFIRDFYRLVRNKNYDSS